MTYGTRRDPSTTNLQSCYSLSVQRRRWCLSAITCSTAYLIVFLSVIHTLLAAAASIPSPCPIPAGSTTFSLIESNHDYVWWNCSLPAGTTWMITPATVTGPFDFANVSILIVGGTVLPYFDLTSTSQSILTITNVSIHFEDYVSSLPISHPFVRLPLACSNVTIVLRICRFAVDGTAFTDQSALSFIGQRYSSMQATNLHIAFHFCTLHAELSRSRSLVALTLANNSNGISLVVEDSTIGITTTDVDVNVFQISSRNQRCTSFSSTTLISDIVFRLQRSNITFTQNCTDPSSLCGNGTKPNWLNQMSDCALLYWDTQNAAIHDAELVVEDTAFQSNLLVLPLPLSDAGTGISRSMTLFTVAGSSDCPCLSQMSVSVSNVTASIVTGKAAALLYFRNVGELSDAVVVVQNSEIALTAKGTLSIFEAIRSVAVIRIDTKTVGPNVTIRVTRVVSYLSALSGERLPAASSSLFITSAALLYCSAGVNNMTVRVRDCRTVTDISGGYLPLFTMDSSYRELLPPMALYNMLSTLLVFDRYCNVTLLHASIVNCSLTSSSGLTMGTASPKELVSAAVISATTLMTITTNCTLSTFVIQGCSVNVASLFFPKMSTQLNTEAFHQQRSGLNTTSGFVLLNITALFLGSATNSLFQATDMKNLMTPIIYDAVKLSIENSSVMLPLSFYDFKRSDVVAFLLTPTFVTNTVIHLSGSMQATQTNTLPVAAISMLSSAVETSIVRVNGLIDAGPMIVAFLGHSSVSASTSFIFANNSFRDAETATTTSASIFASGVTTSLNIHSVKHTGGSVFDISDNTFFGDEHHTLFSNVTWVSSPSPTAPFSGNNTAVLHLGCNLIDNAPLLTSNIGVPRSLLWSIVDFPAGYFQGGQDLTLSAPASLPWCTGLSSTRTIPPPPTEQHPSASSGSTYGATRIAGGVVCVSYALPQLAVSLSSLQRSLQALSLARRCTATGAADAPDDFMADWMSNPLQMHFSSADDGLGWAAGSVVGNVVLIVCLTVVRWLWSSAVAARRSSWSLPVREALRSGFHACGGWVSSYRDAYIALLQPLATAATALAVAPAEAGFTGSPLGYAFSAVGLVVVFAPTVRWAWVVLIVWSRGFPFVQELRRSSTASEVTRASEKAGAGVLLAKCLLQLNHLLFIGDSLVWRLASKPTIPVSDDQRLPMHPADALAYLPIFDELLIARHWYFVVDFAFCVASGVVAGAASFSDKCAWGEWLLVAVSVLNLIVVGVLWPYRSRFSSWSALVNLVLCCVVAILAALWYDAAATAVVSTLTGMSMLPTLFAVVVGIANTVYVKPPHDQRGRDLGCSFDASLSLSMQSASDGGHREMRREAPTAHRLAMLIRMACNASRQRQQHPNKA